LFPALFSTYISSRRDSMQKIALLLLCIAISLSTFTASMASAANPVGKWELVRVETADGKSKPLPMKPKMGGAEFFKDKTVLFSDGLKGEWSISEDSSLKIVLMEFLEMNGEIRGDFLRLSTMVDPDEILVLKKQK
jgi:hypothetical protein